MTADTIHARLLQMAPGQWRSFPPFYRVRCVRRKTTGIHLYDLHEHGSRKWVAQWEDTRDLARFLADGGVR